LRQPSWEVNSKQPEKSLITLMIGKPCHSWRNPKAHVTLSMDVDPKTIPQGLVNGDVFKEVYTEEVKKYTQHRPVHILHVDGTTPASPSLFKRIGIR